MTLQEWQAQDKTPGTILYPPGGKGAGRLVSHIQYGATLDFTKGEASHVDRAYYPFQMLSTTKEKAKPKKTAKPKKENDRRSSNGSRIAVKCVETGEIYRSITEASEAMQTSRDRMKYAIKKHKTINGFIFIEINREETK